MSNRWLKTLILTNFQKHDKLEIHFQPSVNYIYGPSDAGKSCICRALSFLFWNNPRTDDIRKEDTKTTSVKAIFSDDISLERIKSSSINRYVLSQPGAKDREFDSIGVNVPDEIKNLLKFDLLEVDKDTLNLNVSDQISLPFLTDLKPSARYKLFNKITGQDLIDKLVQSFNKDVINLSKDVKKEQENFKNLENQRIELSTKSEQQSKLIDSISTIKENIDNKYLKLQQLINISDKLIKVSSEINKIEGNLTSINIIKQSKLDELIKLINEFTDISNIGIRLDNNKVQFKDLGSKISGFRFVPERIIEELKSKIEFFNNTRKVYSGLINHKSESEAIHSKLNQIKTVNVDFEKTKVKIDQLNTLIGIEESLDCVHTKLEQTEIRVSEISKSITNGELEYSGLLKTAKFCPVCKQSTCKDH